MRIKQNKSGLFKPISRRSLMSFLAILLFTINASAQVSKVSIIADELGSKLQVNGADFIINGMNWDYYPIGTNYTYVLWDQPDEMISAALDREMSLLKEMGVNAIRVYTGITPRWISYIYKKYGIYTILNHTFGRYGITIDGTYISNTDYADPRTRELLLSQVEEMLMEYKDTPGLLIWLLGNENNYGLFWQGSETENIPQDETLESIRARSMYSLFNEAINLIKARDRARPVAICNGDLQFLEIIKEEIKNLDIFGSNVYRGLSFTDAFQKVKEVLDVPLLFTEFGADAYNAREMREDQLSQAQYLLANWKEIYEQTWGKGKVSNCLGGLTFQFSDGWWKFSQDKHLSIHDNVASWANGGYLSDFVETENNMNEEWFGICAKGPADSSGHYELYPRVAYYALQKVHKMDVYSASTDLDYIHEYFYGIDIATWMPDSK